MVKNTNVQSTEFLDTSSGVKCLPIPANRNNSVRCRTANFGLTVMELFHKSTQRIFHKDNSSVSTHHRQRGTKTEFSKKLFFMAMLMSIIAQDRLCTYAAVARVPEYISFDDSVERSKCDVREEIISVRLEHPTLPSNAMYHPSCVKLNRCSGCCVSDSMRCVPTSQYTTKIQISEKTLFPRFTYKLITLDFTHHGSCECQSRDETRPVCVQKACDSQETWDEEECTCITTPGISCVERTCEQGQRWNRETCECEVFCERRVCNFGQRWNEEACHCEASCTVQTCSAGEIWNPATCSCQCRPCHRRRNIPTRVVGNARRCLLCYMSICKYARKKGTSCESRRRMLGPCPCRSRTSRFGR